MGQGHARFPHSGHRVYRSAFSPFRAAVIIAVLLLPVAASAQAPPAPPRCTPPLVDCVQPGNVRACMAANACTDIGGTADGGVVVVKDGSSILALAAFLTLLSAWLVVERYRGRRVIRS
jgi:hypothetical protein